MNRIHSIKRQRGDAEGRIARKRSKSGTALYLFLRRGQLIRRFECDFRPSRGRLFAAVFRERESTGFSWELPRGRAWERASLLFPPSFPATFISRHRYASLPREQLPQKRPSWTRCADISRAVTLLSPRASPLPLSLPCRGNREDADGLFRWWNCSSAPAIIEFAAPLESERTGREGYESCAGIFLWESARQTFTDHTSRTRVYVSLHDFAIF